MTLPRRDTYIVLGDASLGTLGRAQGLHVRDSVLILVPGPFVISAWLLRAPLGQGTVTEAVLRGELAALNIDKSRVRTGEKVSTHSRGSNTAFPKRPEEKSVEESGRTQRQDILDHSERDGRWPSNLLLVYTAGCERTGERKVKATRDRGLETTNARSWKNASKAGINRTGYAGADGMESVATWECVEGCPVALLDRQSGILTTGAMRAEVQRGKFGRHGRYGKANGSGEGRAVQANSGGITVLPSVRKLY